VCREFDPGLSVASGYFFAVLPVEPLSEKLWKCLAPRYYPLVKPFLSKQADVSTLVNWRDHHILPCHALKENIDVQKTPIPLSISPLILFGALSANVSRDATKDLES